MSTEEAETGLDTRIKGMLEQALIASGNIARTAITDEPDDADKAVLDAISHVYNAPRSADHVDLYLSLAHGLHEASDIARNRGCSGEPFHSMAQEFLRAAIHGFGYALAHFATKATPRH